MPAMQSRQFQEVQGGEGHRSRETIVTRAASAQAAPRGRARNIPALTLGAIGIVYGDIGTSPLYTFREAARPAAEGGLTEAEVLGKAMRLGAMLWMSKSTQGGVELRWHPDKRLLQIAMSAGAKPLFGEVAQSRFKSLANAMNAEHEAVDL